MDLGELSGALSDAGYMHSTAQPSADGVLEKDPCFIQAANDAWVRAGAGTRPAEAGFLVGRLGGTVPLAANNEHDLKIPELPGSPANLHTHPGGFGRKNAPSDTDIDVAKKTKRTVYVLSRDGLQAVDPGGKVTTVYSGLDWLK